MVVRSGNLATNLVLEHVGTGEVAAVLADAGCSGRTSLPRGIEDAAARRAGLDNLVTAADLALVMGGVATRGLAAPETCVAVEEVLAAQEHRDRCRPGCPRGPTSPTRPAGSTGSPTTSRSCDPTPCRRTSWWCARRAGLPEDALYALNAAVSAAVWTAVSEGRPR